MLPKSEQKKKNTYSYRKDKKGLANGVGSVVGSVVGSGKKEMVGG